MSEASANIIVAKKPGRKAETPAQRLARLESEMQAARQAVREAEQRKHATIGIAVMAEAENDPEFKAKLHNVLRRRVTSKIGLADIASFVAEPT